MKPLERTGPSILVIALAALTLLTSSPAFAQVDTASVQGTVRDATGAVVPAATVTLLNVDMGVSFQTKTNDVGIYQFPSVRIGRYTIVAEATGESRPRPLPRHDQVVAEFERRWGRSPIANSGDSPEQLG